MSFMIVHLDNSKETLVDNVDLEILYSELNSSSNPDQYVAVTHESDWSISAYPSGKLIMEYNDPDKDLSFIVENSTKSNTLRFWQMLIDGNIDLILSDGWAKDEK